MPNSLPVEDASSLADAARVTAAPLALEGWTAEAKAAFHLRLRARGVRNHAVLRAFEIVPRGLFLPARLAALAARDMPLPLPCGQTSHAPWRVALAIEALAVEPSHRVLEIGSGSGYATAILSHLGGEILGVERWAGLAESAQSRVRDLGVTNAAIVWGDALAVADTIGRFDRILIDAGVPAIAAFDALLAPGGRLVAGHGGRLMLRTAGASRDCGAYPHATLARGVAGKPTDPSFRRSAR